MVESTMSSHDGVYDEIIALMGAIDSTEEVRFGSWTVDEGTLGRSTT